MAGDGGGAKIRPMADQTAMTAALGALAGLLERERARGSDAVALSPEALEQLRGLPAAFQERKRALATAAAAAKVAPAPERATVEPPARAEMAERVEEGEGSWVADTGHRIDRMDSSAVTASSFMPLDADLPEPGSGEGGVVSGPGFEISLVPPAERTEAWRREQLNRIFFALKGAAGPRELGTLFDTLVFAKGNPSADLVFVGEAPGAEEEKQKTPFVGPAGKKLEQILGAMGLSREQVYISNLVKFRPKKGDGRFQHTSNRPPTHEEMAACLPYLRAEMAVVRPRVIVALGQIAAEGLLEKGLSVAAFRRESHAFEGIPVVVTYHPSYLLRQDPNTEEGKRAKRQVWQDMLRAMEVADLPVSDRQRRWGQVE